MFLLLEFILLPHNYVEIIPVEVVSPNIEQFWRASWQKRHGGRQGGLHRLEKKVI